MDQPGSQHPGGDDPATVGRYRILGRLGAGASGRVLLGVDEPGRRVAVRLVDPGPSADTGLRDRFRREVRLAATAPAWFAAPVLDADPDADPPWLATAHVEGPTLAALVHEHGPLGQAGTAALAVRMADGLAALHGAGLVHGGLTPSTVLLADDGPRVIDFGLARVLAPDGPAAGPPAAAAPVPTPAGQAADPGDADRPAQATAGARVAGPAVGVPAPGPGRQDAPADDVLALGALLAFAATGRTPGPAGPLPGAGPGEPATGPGAAAAAAVPGEPDLGPLTGRLRATVAACLSADPSARPTAAQVADTLRAGDGSGLIAQAVAPPGRAEDATVIIPPVTAAPSPRSAPGPVTAAGPVGVAVPAGRPGPAGPPDPEADDRPTRRLPPSAVPAAAGTAAYRVPPWPRPGGQPGRARQRPWGRVAVAAAVAVAVTLGVVVALLTRGGGDGSAGAAATPVAGGRATAQAGPSAAAEVLIDAESDTRFGSGQARFTTPSRNIACLMTADVARCDVAQRSWSLPPAPADCQLAWGTGAALAGQGPAELTCAGDTVAEPALAVLGYGQAVRFRGVVCTSRETGMQCDNARTGHGFTVARASYLLR